MEKGDLDTLKILEDMIRRVVREELQARDAIRPFTPTPAPWPYRDPRVWSLDVPSVAEPTPFVYTAGRHD